MKIPIAKNIQSANQLKDHMLSWTYLYDLLIREFAKYNKNNDLHIVGYKIELVDKLYYCNLKQNIRNIATEFLTSKIDSQFNKEPPESLVNKIANLKPNHKKVGFVFASKYCHFHRPLQFPIFDSFARLALSYLTGNKLIKYEDNYNNFKRDLDEIIEKLTVKSSYSEFDTYLWLLGQWITYKKKGEKPCSNDFIYLVRFYIDLLKDLD